MSSGIWGRVSVGRVAMTLKANRVTRLRRTVLPQGSQGPDGACPPAPPHRPELRAATTCSDFRGSTSPRWPAGDRACAPASVAAARRRFLTPSRGTVRGAPSRGGRSNPPARAPSRPRAGTLLRGRRGRFGTLLQQLECGIFGRTAVNKSKLMVRVPKMRHARFLKNWHITARHTQLTARWSFPLKWPFKI